MRIRFDNFARFGVAAGALLAAPVALLAATISGTVVDPQGRPVPGAQVEAVCSVQPLKATTDEEGRFTVPATANKCNLSVQHPGFAIFEKTVAADTPGCRVQMELLSRQEKLEVSSSSATEDLERSTLTSASLSGVELSSVSNSTPDLIDYVKSMAGALGPDLVYVDGMPAGILPPGPMVARIAVNPDPFSPEYADGDQNHIDVTTRRPSREWRFNFSTGALGAGARDSLAPNAASHSSSGTWMLSGGIPHLPASFSSYFNYGNASVPLAVTAVSPPQLLHGLDWPSGTAYSSSRNRTGNISIYLFPSETFRSSFTYGETRLNATNSASGGLTVPQAGLADNFAIKNLRAAVDRVWRSLIFDSGLAFIQTSATSHANSAGLGVTVAGEFNAGGAALTASSTTRTNWTWKNVLHSDFHGKLITAGFTWSRTRDSVDQIPNASGILQFSDMADYSSALAGAGTGTLLFSRGNGTALYAGNMAAAFAQMQVVKTSHFLLTTGIRADYQAGFSPFPCPRISASTEWGRFIFRTGGAIFVHNVPASIFLEAIENDGHHLDQFLAPGVSLQPDGTVNAILESPLTWRLQPALTRPRQIFDRSSVERRLGPLKLGAEYTWTRDDHRLGARRLESGDAFTNLIESNRDARAERVHTQLTYILGPQRLFVYYDWIHARDDGDGPFSFPANQNDIRAEWARTAGISPQNVRIGGNFVLPHGVSASLIDTWRGSAPFNITTGLDPEGFGLFNDRGGLPRDSGDGPGYNSLSFYTHKRFSLPTLSQRRHFRLYGNLGVQGDNLLGNRNYLSVGSVIGAPTFGKPLVALPGRSLRVWLTFE